MLVEDSVATLKFLLGEVIMHCPKDTRNLVNSTGYADFDGVLQLYIGGDKAPYMGNTNEKWAKGKNPNEGWFDDIVKRTLEIASGDVNIEYKKGGKL